MSNIKYAGCLYPTVGHAARAMVEDWLTADGRNTHDDIMESLVTGTDADLVAEMEGSWVTEGDNPWYSHDEGMAAMAWFRARETEDE